MGVDFYYQVLEVFESLGVSLSIVAWLTVFFGCLGLILLLQRERRSSIWKAAGLVGVLALVANLADFFVTFYRSPDLGLEANPIWRIVVDNWGVTVAWWYGFSGKILLSILAGLMYAFYLKRRDRLYPERAVYFFEFMRRMGGRAQTRRDRLAGLFTVLCFFFAGIQFFCFYIALLNWQVYSDSRPQMPSALLVLVLMLLVIGAVFLILTYRSFQNWEKNQK